MARPYLLPNEAGVVWLPSDDTDRAVLFPFQNLTLPATVHAHVLVDELDTVLNKRRLPRR